VAGLWSHDQMLCVLLISVAFYYLQTKLTMWLIVLSVMYCLCFYSWMGFQSEAARDTEAVTGKEMCFTKCKGV